MGESTATKVKHDPGNGVKAATIEKDVQALKELVVLRFSQQDKVLEELHKPRSDWKPMVFSLLSLFGIFMVALGSTLWPIRNRVELLEKGESSTKELYQKDKELMAEKLRSLERELADKLGAINRELIWHFDNTKVRIGAVEQKQELWMKPTKPETRP